ncbi:hypothetical protein OUZ56_005919 [Daphnia magna]|uniref:Uncharacterized protein n=1 Tax=Daphnia magna TaxID=35525 RepID=A0ABQ9YU47_9CRUS|nr:hypothetical protein OUZ56_005919 [Daphnia magna]
MTYLSAKRPAIRYKQPQLSALPHARGQLAIRATTSSRTDNSDMIYSIVESCSKTLTTNSSLPRPIRHMGLEPHQNDRCQIKRS